jgi:hypothetical protein
VVLASWFLPFFSILLCPFFPLFPVLLYLIGPLPLLLSSNFRLKQSSSRSPERFRNTKIPSIIHTGGSINNAIGTTRIITSPASPLSIKGVCARTTARKIEPPITGNITLDQKIIFRIWLLNPPKNRYSLFISLINYLIHFSLFRFVSCLGT